jgi:hypothetical protein
MAFGASDGGANAGPTNRPHNCSGNVPVSIFSLRYSMTSGRVPKLAGIDPESRFWFSERNKSPGVWIVGSGWMLARELGMEPVSKLP